MSWQTYVDEQLVGTGQLDGAIIIGLDGNSWASKNLTLKAGEGQAIAALFKTPANVFASGITINGIKYMGIKGDSRSIYGKKGATGVATVITGQCILIGYYNEKQQPGNAALVVEKLADYLIENGY
uniref:Profilin-P n=1 Tax=Physarum polycephalum TaxID=5791 RepID=PROF2_PHYPO|nr:RecName: Full=Profilin-P [Physarum polycephalum]